MKTNMKSEEKAAKKEDNKSCFQKIRESRDKNNGSYIEFVKDVIQILLKTCLSLIIFLINNVIGFTCIVIGIIFIHDCPAKPSIPILLIIYGVLSMIYGAIIEIMSWNWFDIRDDSNIWTLLTTMVLSLTSIAIIVTFIITCFAVYGIAFPEYDKDSGDDYCNAFLYLVAFVLITTILVIILLLIFIFCCFCCCLIPYTAGVIAAEENKE